MVFLLPVFRWNAWSQGGVRTYIKNFWAQNDGAYPFPGHMAQSQAFFRHRKAHPNKRQFIPRPKESRRLRKEGHDSLMTTLAGRKMIFEKIMKDELFRGEF